MERCPHGGRGYRRSNYGRTVFVCGGIGFAGGVDADGPEGMGLFTIDDNFVDGGLQDGADSHIIMAVETGDEAVREKDYFFRGEGTGLGMLRYSTTGEGVELRL